MGKFRFVHLLLFYVSRVITNGLAADEYLKGQLQRRDAAGADAQGGLRGHALHSETLELPGLLISNTADTGTSQLPMLAANATNHGRNGNISKSRSTSQEHAKKIGAANMFRIFALCVSMYGGIAFMWLLFWRLPEDHSIRASGRVLLLCATWASMSIGMQVLNKTLVTELKAPALISVGQMWIAVVLVGIPSYRDLLEAPRKQLMIWLVVPLFFAAMLCTSCYTYEYISLSFYTVIRNMTPLLVLPIERTVMPADKRPRLSTMVLLSMGVMLAGAVLYGGGVGSVSIVGCIFAFANMLLAVGDRLIQRRLLTTECNGLASTVCTIMNNAFGSIPALMLAFATHQISDMSSPEGRASWTDPHVIVLLVMSGAIGIGICYLGFECQRAISATSFFVLQNFSKVAVVICGIILFQDPIKSPSALAGLTLSISGSFCYGRAQMALQEQAAAEQKRRQKLAEQACREPPAVQKPT